MDAQTAQQVAQVGAVTGFQPSSAATFLTFLNGQRALAKITEAAS